MRDVLNHINGRDQGAQSGQTLDNWAPATGGKIGTVPRSDARDVTAAVNAATQAAPDFAATSAEERAKLLVRLSVALQDNAQHLAELESEDTGKPISLAKTIDIPRAISNIRFFADAIRQDETASHHMADALNYTYRKPLGVVGLITPWNLPLYLLTWKVGPALATGNTIVAKPSEFTPSTASKLAQLATEAGIGPGVLNIVHGLGAEAGAPLVQSEQVAGVSFTGGTATGKQVAAAASGSFKKLSLELGGKNATLVFADADLDKAAAGAVRAAFTNQGQVCLCGSRILVSEEIADDFVARMQQALTDWYPADPRMEGTKLGALISSAHRDKIERYVQIARDEGGTILSGGQRAALGGDLAGGYFFQPTLVDGLPIDSRTATEEIFGPVITIHRFKTEEQAIAMANGVRYGLAASVWTQDVKRAHKVATALDTGMVWVNTWLKRDLRVPFGGVKASGVGREGGRYSLDFYSHQQNICIDLS